MPKGYFQIPDWFSFDNQGGGVAVADVTGVGNQDLLVITVDNPGDRIAASTGWATAWTPKVR